MKARGESGKKIIMVCALAVLVFAVALIANFAENGVFAPKMQIPEGAKTATGKGEDTEGEVVIEVVADENGIYSVKVVQITETDGIGPAAVDKIPQAILDAQGTDVDVVAGATITSQAIIDGANKALESMGY